MDIFPTLLDWFSIKFRPYRIFERKVHLTGKSLLPVTKIASQNGSRKMERNVIYASQAFHNIIMYYPMRVVRTHRYKLIHNLSNRTPFPIASNLYLAPTYQDLYNKTAEHWPTGWYKSIDAYYYRPEFELYDLIADSAELTNLADIPKYKLVRQKLAHALRRWQNVTMDPWICAPHGVLMERSPWVAEPGCYPLYNEPE